MLNIIFDYIKELFNPKPKIIESWEHDCEVKRLYLILDKKEKCEFCNEEYSSK
tara:strand:+ start:847 stop:1005 length:159 start_codon:yes stop_codon:yes gene_type:complete